MYVCMKYNLDQFRFLTIHEWQTHKTISFEELQYCIHFSMQMCDYACQELQTNEMKYVLYYLH